MDEILLDNDLRDIGWAVAALRAGNRVFRSGWNGKGMFLYWSRGFNPGGKFIINGFETTAFLPFIAMRTVDGSCVPWTCSQSDLLATDWGIQDWNSAL